MDTTGAPVDRRTSTKPAQGRFVAVDVLACGTTDENDDSVGWLVAAMLRDRLAPDIRVRLISRLAIDDLLGIAKDASAVVVDTADGLRGGRVLSLPLDSMVGRAAELRPRRCGALGFPEVLGVAGMVRGHPLEGQIVLVGAVRTSPRGGLSPSVRRALPKLASAIEAACTAVRASSLAA